EFIARLQEAVAHVRPTSVKGNTAYDASGLASLDKAVLVDLTGNPVAKEAAPGAVTIVDDLFEQPPASALAQPEESGEKPTLRETKTLRGEPAPPPPARPPRRWPWLLPIPALGLAAALMLPKLGGPPAETAAKIAARPTA